MVIEQIYGINATSMSMNERFTILQSAGVGFGRWKPENTLRNTSLRNRRFFEQADRRLEIMAKRKAVRERLGFTWRRGQLRRFGSESSLPNMLRSDSYGNINQFGVKNRLWMGANGNLSRSSSFNNLAQGMWRLRRAPRRRGANRGRFRGGARGGVTRPIQRNPRGGGGGRGRGRGARAQVSQQGRGRGRGGISRNSILKKPIPTKEELDEQLEQYMACTKSALDKDLDVYMKNAMEFE